MDQTTNTEQTKEQYRAEQLRLSGLTEERTVELKNIMVAAAEKLREQKLQLTAANIIHVTTPMITEVNEALFIGIIFGQSLAAMENPMMTMMALLSKLKDR